MISPQLDGYRPAALNRQDAEERSSSQASSSDEFNRREMEQLLERMRDSTMGGAGASKV